MGAHRQQQKTAATGSSRCTQAAAGASSSRGQQQAAAVTSAAWMSATRPQPDVASMGMQMGVSDDDMINAHWWNSRQLL